MRWSAATKRHEPDRGHGNRTRRMCARGLRLNPGNRAIGAFRLETVDRGLETGRRQHQQVVRTIHCQVDGIERVTAHDPQPPVLRPGIDALEDPVYKVERAMGVEDPSPERLETTGELLHLGALRGGRRNGRCRSG